jgi:hypothetical protein
VNPLGALNKLFQLSSFLGCRMPMFRTALPINYSFDTMNHRPLLSSVFKLLVCSAAALLGACGGGSDGVGSGGTTGTEGSSSSSSGTASSSGGSSSSSSSGASSTSSSSGQTASPYTLKVVGGNPVDQIACGPDPFKVSSGPTNSVANLTWLNCTGGLGARVDVSPNQSSVQIRYGNAVEGVVTFEPENPADSSVVVNYAENTVSVNATKLVATRSEAGTKGTKLSVPAQIAVQGTLKF